MTRDELTQAIGAFSDPEDEAQLAALDQQLQALAQTGVDPPALAAMIGVLERFPGHDGFGVFWSLVHALEHFGGYEAPLLQSLRRRPSPFTVLLAQRLQNGGVTQIDGVPLLALLQQIADDEGVHPEARRDAASFVACQHARSPTDPGDVDR